MRDRYMNVYAAREMRKEMGRLRKNDTGGRNVRREIGK